MRLTCPECGAVASLAAWATDLEARAMVEELTALPWPALGLNYIKLFRKPSSPRGLGWGRARKLVAELAALVTAQEIGWDSNPGLTNRPGYWEAALGVILEREALGKVQRPLTNHNLLRCIAYEQAAKAGEEQRKRDAALRAYPVPNARETREGPRQADLERNASRAKEVLAKLRAGRGSGGQGA